MRRTRRRIKDIYGGEMKLEEKTNNTLKFNTAYLFIYLKSNRLPTA